MTLDDLASEASDGEIIEFVRVQEAELPQALKWQVLRADEDCETMTVEPRRSTGEALRVTSETYALATVASDADRPRRRALLEELVWRETASFRLPRRRPRAAPARQTLAPGTSACICPVHTLCMGCAWRWRHVSGSVSPSPRTPRISRSSAS
jgi:hypothetical protein